jgi:hypothetical protein
MFDFFLQGDALFVGIQINISHSDFKPLRINHTVGFPYSLPESGRAMRRRLKIFL